MGTRVSARLRGTQTNEWQSIPDEWLNELPDVGRRTDSDDGNTSSRGTKRTHNDQDDSVSELTELSDDSDDPDTILKRLAPDEQVGDSVVERANDPVKEEVEKSVLDDFVEWETVRQPHSTITSIMFRSGAFYRSA